MTIAVLIAASQPMAAEPLQDTPATTNARKAPAANKAPAPMNEAPASNKESAAGTDKESAADTDKEFAVIGAPVSDEGTAVVAAPRVRTDRDPNAEELADKMSAGASRPEKKAPKKDVKKEIEAEKNKSVRRRSSRRRYQSGWEIYSQVDLFAFSETIAVDKFVNKFDANLEGGDTAFTHNLIEAGVKWRGLKLAYVHRFDYVTRFTEDTARFHHSEKNQIAIDQRRVFDLLLSVERIQAKGIKVGYETRLFRNFSVSADVSWYDDISQLQSGSAAAIGNPDPITPEIMAEIDALADTVDLDDRDISALNDILRDVTGNLHIDYAYDEPKFNERFYREPVIIGDPNPVLTGVDFSAPAGEGYAVDIGIAYSPTEWLDLRLKLYDVVNEFTWDNAPVTTVSFDVTALKTDLIQMIQDFANGGAVAPNDLVARNLVVDIRNQAYTQELLTRTHLSATWHLPPSINLAGWKPHLAIVGEYYDTGVHEFPRLGFAVDGLELAYDFGGKAYTLTYRGDYLYAQLIADTLDTKNARTFGVGIGINIAW
jgi:hypothetical protein